MHVKCGGPRSGPTPGTTLCASLRSWNAFGHFTKTIVEKLPGKMPGPTIATHTLCEPAQSKCIWMRLDIAQQALIREFAGKMPQTKSEDHTGDQTVCEPAQLKCARTFHKSHFAQELTRKMPGTTIATHTLCKPAQFRTPRSGTTPGTTLLCEPARSKCTWTFHKLSTLWSLCENLQVKCRRPAGASWSNTGLYTHSKNPSAWNSVYTCVHIVCRIKSNNVYIYIYINI